MLLLLCILFPLWFAFRRSVSEKGVEVNHVTLFTFGFLFYWILPIAAGAVSSTLAGETWTYLFDSSQATPLYLAACFLSYIAFVSGDLVAAAIFRPRAFTPLPLNASALLILLIPATIAAAFMAYSLRSLLFQPYGMDLDAQRARGTMTAFVIPLGIIALFHISDNHNYGVRRLAMSGFVLPFLCGSVLLLYIGSRLYVVSFVLMFAVYLSCFVHRITPKRLVIAVVVVATLSGLIGVLRLHSGSSLADLGINIILEPMFTSLSLVHFLSYDHVAWINFPRYLISDFVNLIPTAILPNKADLIQFPEVYNPLGAMHSFVSFNYNFGILGTAAFMFVLSLTLRWLRTCSSRQLGKVCYVMLCGWLAFTFFRDPFSISLVKVMFQYSLIVPSLIIMFNRLVQPLPMVKSEYILPSR
jgi:oligosaccharide repeat unit polymerase